MLISEKVTYVLTVTSQEYLIHGRSLLNLFRFLSEEELEEVNLSRYEVSFHAGETVFKQGGPLTHIACITSGMAKVYLEGNKSKSIILKIIKPSELIGGPGFQVDNRHHFSVAAMTNVKACFINIDSFESMLKKNNQFAMEFINHLNYTTILLYSKMQNLIQKQMHGRIAETLLYLSRSIYNNSTFETELSRQDIADMSAMTKESAIRIIKEFRDEGILECESNTFKILNESHLVNIIQTG